MKNERIALRQDLLTATEFLVGKLGADRAKADILHALGITAQTLSTWRRQGPPERRASLIHWLLRYAQHVA